MDCKFSIIIPHYGIPDKLERLLSSIPVREDIQIIVVDDCSEKTVLKQLDVLKFKFTNVDFYSTGTNGGGGKARNIGLKAARGKYVLFADADDFFLYSLNSILDLYADSDYDLIYFNAISLVEDSYNISNRTSHLNSFIGMHPKNPELSELKLRYIFGEPWCKIIKRSIIDDNNITFQECKVHNDTLFSYEVGLAAKSVAVCDVSAYVVIDRPFSVSKTTNWEKQKLAVEIFAKKNRVLSDKNISVFDPLLFNPFIKCLKSLNLRLFIELKDIANKYGYSVPLLCYKFFVTKVKTKLN